MLQRGDASRESSSESVRATSLQRGDASKGSESLRATLLQRDDASRGSPTESVRATSLQRGDASRGSSTESARATLLQRVPSSLRPLIAVFARNRLQASCSAGAGVWTTLVPHLPLFTQQVRTLGAEMLVAIGKSRRALVHLQLFP